MGKRRVPEQRCVEVSEPWLMEWFEWGYRCLGLFLAKQAAFDAWLAEHERKEIA